MTNKEAAEIMKAIIFMLNNEFYTDEVEEAIHMAINVLTAQPEKTQLSEEDATSDCISRNAAIEAVDEALTRVFVEHRDIAEKMINKIPSAQPQHDISKANFLCPICGAEMEVAVSEWEGEG